MGCQYEVVFQYDLHSIHWDAGNAGIFLPKKLTCDEPSFPGSGWASSCCWAVLHAFLASLCLRVWLLLRQLNCLYLNPRVPVLFPLQSSPHPTWGQWASGRVLLSCLWSWSTASALRNASWSDVIYSQLQWRPAEKLFCNPSVDRHGKAPFLTSPCKTLGAPKRYASCRERDRSLRNSAH